MPSRFELARSALHEYARLMNNPDILSAVDEIELLQPNEIRRLKMAMLRHFHPDMYTGSREPEIRAHATVAQIIFQDISAAFDVIIKRDNMPVDDATYISHLRTVSENAALFTGQRPRQRSTWESRIEEELRQAREEARRRERESAEQRTRQDEARRREREARRTEEARAYAGAAGARGGYEEGIPFFATPGGPRERRGAPPPEPGEMVRLIIESYPMLGVPIKISRYVRGEELTGDYLTRRFGRKGTLIFGIVEDFRKRTFRKREDAKNWLNEQILGLEILNPGSISELILEREFDKTKKGKQEDILGVTDESKEFREGISIEGSGRWRPRGYNLIPVGENFKTTLYIDLPRTLYMPKDVAHNLYNVEVPTEHEGYKFVEWRETKRSAGILVPVTHSKNSIDIPLIEPIRLIAVYTKTAEHKDRPQIRSPYQSGVSPGRVAGTKDAAMAALKFAPLGRKISKDIKRTSLKEMEENPALNAAINKGKRILNRYAKAEYSRIFEGPDGLRAEYRWRANELRNMRNDARDAKRQLRRIIRNSGALNFRQRFLHRTNEDTINAADQLAAGGLAGSVALVTARDTLRRYLEARDKFYEDFKRDLSGASAQLRDYLEKKSETVSTGIARRYKIPVNSGDEKKLAGALKGYAAEIAEDFATRGRTIGHMLFRGLGAAGRGMQTFGGAWNNLIANIWSFATGPWIWGTLFVMLQFFFILTYVGYNLTYLWIFPFIAAIFAFLVNISETVQPLDWYVHLVSGAMIGYSAVLFMLALYLPRLSFMNTFWFWIIWAGLGTLGLFQFYQTDGFRTVLMGSIFILLFAYVALGPYSGYYQLVLDQVGEPLEIAYRAVSRAVSDVWLLATNPTEWYARQQLVNVRPERPLSFPKAVEISTLDSLPESAPGNSEFTLTAIIKNEGTIEARDIAVGYTCNQWCEARRSGVNVPINNMGMRGNVFLVGERMDRGEAAVITVPGFVAVTEESRAAEFRTAKVTFNVSYTTNTSSTLLVDVVTQAELNRRFLEREEAFRNVVAVAKNTPAQVSLNVGPQPLVASNTTLREATINRAQLLVAVLNQRDDSTVVLEPGTIIIIRMQKVIGTNLECTAPSNPKARQGGADERAKFSNAVNSYFESVFGNTSRAGFISNANRTNDIANEIEKEAGIVISLPEDAETVIIPVFDRWEIPEFDTQSILAFTCVFDVALDTDVRDVKTGIVTAEIPEYRFVQSKEKIVPVTPPLGILADTFEPICNLCRGASCDRDACHDLSDIRNSCWYDDSTEAPIVSSVTDIARIPGGTVCHSCGDGTCDIFRTESNCEEAREQCGFTYCKWNAEAAGTSILPGRCEGTPPADVTRAGAVIGLRCSTAGICVGASGSNSALNHKQLIEDAVRATFPPERFEEGVRVVGAVMRQESLCNQYTGATDASGISSDVVCSSARAVGLMQVLPSTAAQLGSFDLCSAEDNVVAGAAYLWRQYENYWEEYVQWLTGISPGAGLPPDVANEELWKLAFAAYNAGPGRVGPGTYNNGLPSAIKQSANECARTRGADECKTFMTFDEIRQYLPGQTQTYVPAVFAAAFRGSGATCYVAGAA